MNIFGTLFVRNKMLKEVMIVEGLTDNEMLKEDMKQVNELSDQLSIFGSVLTYRGESFFNSINISTQEDYPIVEMDKISEDHKCWSDWCGGQLDISYLYIVKIKPLVSQSCYTYDGAMLYIKKYYEIREKHLKELFPVK